MIDLVKIRQIPTRHHILIQVQITTGMAIPVMEKTLGMQDHRRVTVITVVPPEVVEMSMVGGDMDPKAAAMAIAAEVITVAITAIMVAAAMETTVGTTAIRVAAAMETTVAITAIMVAAAMETTVGTTAIMVAAATEPTVGTTAIRAIAATETTVAIASDTSKIRKLFQLVDAWKQLFVLAWECRIVTVKYQE